MRLRIISLVLLLCALTAVCALAVSASALSYTENVQTQTFYSGALSEDDDSEELFEAYAERTLYPERAISLWGTNARSRLSANDKHLYDHLKASFADIANGTLASSTVSISTDTLNSWGVKTKWTNTDMSVTYITDPNTVAELFWEQFDVSAIEAALLFDCPYEMYWFDKTQGFSWGTSLNLTGYGQNKITSATVNGPSFIFSVCQAYRAAAYDMQAPTLNTQKTGATVSAASNAMSIVEEFKSYTDYEKLVAYKNRICALTSYNNSVTDTGVAYGDPWQIIYVFDGDPSTNVVCEGYSKAFQYLCDLTEFKGDIYCYTVTGDMAGGSHMWNTVTMENGSSYLVDVTNSDSGMAGSDGRLFLAGATGSIASGYTLRAGGITVKYAYNQATKDTWGADSDSPLSLASSSYTSTYSPISISVPNKITYKGRPITAGYTSADVTYSVSGTGYTVSHAFYTSSASATPVAPRDAGEYLLTVTAVSSTGQEYKKSIWITVEKAELTVTPHNASIIYGNAPRTEVFADTVGFVGTDTLADSDLTGTLSAAHTYAQYGNVGEYPFTVSGYHSNNYNIKYNKGYLTVLPATLTVSWFNTELTYGDKTTVTATVSGVLNNDDVSVSVSGASAEVGTHTVIASLTGKGAGNYVIKSGTESATLTVNKRPCKLDIDIPDRTYGDAPASIPSLPEGATVTYIGNGYSSKTPPMTVGEYTVLVSYETKNEIYTGSDTFTVRKKQLTVESITLDADRSYETGNMHIAVEGLTLSGIVDTDNVQVDLASGLFAILSSDAAGEYSCVLLNTADIILIGDASSNYELSGKEEQISAAVTVHPQAAQEVTVRVSDTKFDGNPATPKVTVMIGDTVISEDEYEVIYKNNDRVGTATVTVVDKDGGNYDIPETGSTFRITSAEQDTDNKKKEENTTADISPIVVEPSGGCGSSVSMLPLALITLVALSLVIKRKRNKS